MIISGRHRLALVRVSAGVLFLASALDKTTSGWLTTGQPLVKSVQQNLDKSEGFYRSFLEGTVLPQAPVFTRLITIGEWVVGVSLLLGLLTRVGAFAGMWLLLNYMLMKGTLLHGYDNGQTYSDRLYFVASVAFLLVGAGRAWGLDGALRPWLERVPLVRWLAGIDHPFSGAAASADRAVPEPIHLAAAPRRRAPAKSERRAA
jgi:uncharacterized membrane protein YphA (DoxX/SURF4 family)